MGNGVQAYISYKVITKVISRSLLNFVEIYIFIPVLQLLTYWSLVVIWPGIDFIPIHVMISLDNLLPNWIHNLGVSIESMSL